MYRFIAVAVLLAAVVSPTRADDSPRVYATFQCMTVDNMDYCNFAPLSVPQLQSSRRACEQSITYVYRVRADKDGRFWLKPGLWFECRSKPSDEWQR